VRGSIRTKVGGKVYELRVALGKDPVTGRYRQKSVTVRGSRAEAQRALRRLLEEVEDGQHRALEGGSRTFAELLDEWLAHKAATDRSPTTIARYRSVIEWQLKPTLGAVPLERLETKAFDDLYRSLAARLEPASIRKAHIVARSALDRAVRWGWIRRNPAATAEPPPVRAPDVRSPDPDDVRRLIAAAERHDPLFAVFLRLAAATGARRGELCALRWSDLDLDAARLTIERSLIVVDGGVREAPTKTHNRRVIALDRGTLECLHRHLDRQRRLARRCGSELARDAFVFSRRPGGTHPLRPDNCTTSFDRLRRATGVSGFSLKDATRHLAATRLIAAGVDVRTVAGRLGHSRASTTLDVYSHWLPGRDAEAAGVIGQLLDASDEPTRSEGSSKRRVRRA
jgi:integrase